VRKSLGLIGLILALSFAAAAWEGADNQSFLTPQNWANLLTWIGLFGILSLAQSVVIITGGIDLSVGSVVALVGISAAMLMDKGAGWHPVLVLPFCLLLAGGLGAGHGLLITKARMQPFVVTLCGLFVYRGVARFFTGDMTQGFGTAYGGLRWFGNGSLLGIIPGWNDAPRSEWTQAMHTAHMISAPFVVMIVVAIGLAAYLHFSARGRHLFALGANEEAARLSGLNTQGLTISAYILCSVLSGLAGLLIAFKVNSLGPSDFGSFYELYAIAGAVLGGCSLRGGTGNVLGVVLGISLIMILRNLVNILGIPSQLEYVVIGGAILVGLLIDELLGRRGMRVKTAG
jgi:ribose transport system permease protein